MRYFIDWINEALINQIRIILVRLKREGCEHITKDIIAPVVRQAMNKIVVGRTYLIGMSHAKPQ